MTISRRPTRRFSSGTRSRARVTALAAPWNRRVCARVSVMSVVLGRMVNDGVAAGPVPGSDTSIRYRLVHRHDSVSLEEGEDGDSRAFLGRGERILVPSSGPRGVAVRAPPPGRARPAAGAR